MHTTPVLQKAHSRFYNVYLVIPMVLNLQNGMGPGGERGSKAQQILTEISMNHSLLIYIQESYLMSLYLISTSAKWRK